MDYFDIKNVVEATAVLEAIIRELSLGDVSGKGIRAESWQSKNIKIITQSMSRYMLYYQCLIRTYHVNYKNTLCTQ